MTPDRKEIIHCIKDLSANSHTANFLADQLNDVISKCQKIVKYFKQSHQAGEELRSKITNEIKGGELKSYVVTRWTTGWDCTNSILRLEQVFKNVREDVFTLYTIYMFIY